MNRQNEEYFVLMNRIMKIMSKMMKKDKSMVKLTEIGKER
jgi:hypothetical protein